MSWKTKLYLIVDNQSVVGGFYTINNGSLSKDEQLPLGSGKRNYPYRTIGTVHIGRLARHKQIVGQSLGTKVMHFAFSTASEVSKISGASILTIDAKDMHAEQFYIGCGFKALNQAEGAPTYPKPLFLKMKEVRAIINPN